MKTVVVLMMLAISSACHAADRPSTTDITESAGRLLINKLGCTSCHSPSEAQSKWLQPKAAPRLTGIGGRADGNWLTKYLAAPQETMPGTTMPDVLHHLAPAARTEAAEALTHFLLSRQPLAFKRTLPDRAAVAHGESLYHRIGCVACHAPQSSQEKTIPSVPLPHMAEKWSFDGLRRFLLDPLASRPSGRMPALRLTDSEASDIAHYLLRATRVAAHVELAMYQDQVRSLEEIDTAPLARTGPAGGLAIDSTLRDRRNAMRFSAWLDIEQPGNYIFYFSATGSSRLAIDGKWIAGQDSWESKKVDATIPLHLDSGWHDVKIDYVPRGNQPAAMKLEWQGPGIGREGVPSSKLRSEREAVSEPAAFVVDATKAAAGRALYEQLRCAACHEAKPVESAPLALSALHDEKGCLAETLIANAPDFHLVAPQRTALRAAIASLKRSDTPPSSQQRLAMTLATFNCTACHVRDGVGGVAAERDPFFTSNVPDTGDEGRLPPRLDDVGNKLQPAWLTQVLVDGASVRPSLDTRMPQFGAENVGFLPELLVALDRNPDNLPHTDDPVEVQKEAGRKIVGTSGLSCIACHRFNGQAAQTFQAIDLTTVSQRLNQDWFNKFLLDPNRFHPGTRMPAFWPGGKSLLESLLGGDTARQHAALWTYLSDGPRSKFPEGLSRQGVELVVGGEAVVYRGKLWEAGFRAIAIGYPGQLNAAFDAEEMRLSLLWRGRFLNAGPHWNVQGMGQIQPLGTDVIIFPHGSPMALLADENAPWPTDSSKTLGMKFHGYQLDSIRRPTLLYSFGSMSIEDFLSPTEHKPGLHRTIRFIDPAPQGLYFRIAVGKLIPVGENTWRLNDSLTLTVKGGGKPITRGNREEKELLVPVHFSGNGRQIEVDYVW